MNRVVYDLLPRQPLDMPRSHWVLVEILFNRSRGFFLLFWYWSVAAVQLKTSLYLIPVVSKSHFYLDIIRGSSLFRWRLTGLFLPHTSHTYGVLDRITIWIDTPRWVVLLPHLFPRCSSPRLFGSYTVYKHVKEEEGEEKPLSHSLYVRVCVYLYEKRILWSSHRVKIKRRRREEIGLNSLGSIVATDKFFFFFFFFVFLPLMMLFMYSPRHRALSTVDSKK